MPRDGTGASDNGPFEAAGHDIAHGAGPAESTRVPRADKTATPPPEEKGDGLPGLPGSGQGSKGIKGHTGQGSKHTLGSEGGD
ncbi:hypothetical protein K490DRAFT_68183 [Saccharata proteae CBS 121410]|uniref:Uncharacterized protein n=1 Tax=Saccharata proteae CBS 121410 TaxID=1314787 RepID=A0A9P4HST0_9PEZI|nr:hypothetical protein K490DRAFT_68183 [Saccharata proteae CBS 121410]